MIALPGPLPPHRRTPLPALLAAAALAALLTPAASWAESDTTAADAAAEPAPAPASAPAAADEPRTRYSLYGYVKLDASYDSAVVEPGNFARWVISPSRVEEHDHFNMTARQSRLGLRISAPKAGRLTLGARFEVDFYGGGAENKNLLLLRHALLELADPDAGWTLLAGQTSDLVSPLAPGTVNYTAGWWVGNIGYRRPQIRFTRLFERPTSACEVAVAVARTVGDDFVDLEPGDAGSDSGLPSLQARVAGGRELASGRRATVGLSGHWGRENVKLSAGDAGLKLDSWSLDLDLTLPLGGATLTGELFRGSNLDDYLGGIGQGINLDRRQAIGARGGWLSLALSPTGLERLAFGLGVDDPDDVALPAGGRARNRAAWVGAARALRPDLDLALEISYWRTDYVGLESGDSWRLQTAFIYDF